MKKQKKELIFPICEIYPAVQAENNSRTFGMPTIFIRFSGCNLCCFKCDSSYASSKIEKVYNYNEHKVVREIEKVMNQYPNISNITFTGGSPLLVQEQLCFIISKFPQMTYDVETNGTIMPNKFLQKYIDNWNVSPKLSLMCNSPLRINKEVLTFYNKKDNAVFKFVVSTEKDIKELEELKLDNNKIILMPEGFDQKKINEATNRIIELAKKYGYRMTPRLHIMLYGKKRGK